MPMKLRFKTKKKTGSTLPVINVPDNWNRLTRKQLLTIVNLFKFDLDITAYRVIAFNALANVKLTGKSRENDPNGLNTYQVKNQYGKFWITASLYHELLKTVDFISKPPTLTNQLFPTIRVLGTRLYGPEEACYNITYNELIYAQLAYTNFTNTKEVKHLNELVAVLYRPRKKKLNKRDPKWNGDKREPFSAFLYQNRSWWMRFIPWKVKYAIYVFYSGSLAHMEAEHPLCFKAGTRISSTPKQSNPAKELIDLIPVITKNDPTKEKDILNASAYTVFDHYESARKEHEASKPKN